MMTDLMIVFRKFIQSSSKLFVLFVTFFVFSGCGGGPIDIRDELGFYRGNMYQEDITPYLCASPMGYIGSVSFSSISPNISLLSTEIVPPISRINLFFYNTGLKLEVHDSVSESDGIFPFEFNTTNRCGIFSSGANSTQVAIGVLTGYNGADYYVLFKDRNEDTWKTLGMLDTSPPIDCHLPGLNGFGSNELEWDWFEIV